MVMYPQRLFSIEMLFIPVLQMFVLVSVIPVVQSNVMICAPGGYGDLESSTVHSV